MAFLDKNGLQTLTNKLVQGDAIKVASHRGHTVKNVIDNITRECENIATPNTMTLENRVNEFKVGKGRDVDVSGDVEEGKVEVELKGKTCKNILNDFNSNNVRPATSNVSIDFDNKEITLKSRGNWVESSYSLRHSLKDNTVYTIVLKVTKVTLNQKRLRVSRGINVGVETYIDIPTAGIYREKFTTNSSKATDWGKGQFWISIRADNVEGEVTFKDVILLEGDYTQTPIEELPKYLEGIKSSFEDGIVDVEVTGKNLIEKNSFETGNGLLDITNVIKTGETYSLSYKIDSMSSDTPYIRLRFQGRNKDGSTDYFGEVFAHEYIGKRVFPKPLKFNKQYEKIELLLQVFNHGATCSISDVQLEMSTVATPYEPYYKKKISFNIGEPLRSLPNGICDEIRNNNGQWELVRKIGKVILDGSEQWRIATGNNNNNTMYWNVDNIGNAKTYVAPGIIPNLICDKISITSYNTAFNMNKDSTMMCLTNRNKSTTNSIAIRMLNPNNHAGVLSEWLSQNPTTVYYELQTPIVTPIDPIEFEVKPLATMTINSEIAPTSNHKVILNRAGQIEQGIIQIAELKSRVDALETAYDSYLLETQHKLSILGFEYELESEEV